MSTLKKYIPYVIGFIFLYNGILFSYLYFDGHSPFIQPRPRSDPNQVIGPYTTHDFGGIIGITASPFPITINLEVSMEGTSDFQIFVSYETSQQTYDIGSEVYSGTNQANIYFDLRDEKSTLNGFVVVSVRNLGPSSITVRSFQVSELPLQLGLYIWIVCTVVGLFIMLFTFFFRRWRNKRRSRRIFKDLPTKSPEPVLFHKLQEETHSRQRSSVKSKGSNQKLKPTSIQANKCPKCGGIVPKKSTNCPHCYTILKS